MTGTVRRRAGATGLRAEVTRKDILLIEFTPALDVDDDDSDDN